MEFPPAEGQRISGRLRETIASAILSDIKVLGCPKLGAALGCRDSCPRIRPDQRRYHCVSSFDTVSESNGAGVATVVLWQPVRPPKRGSSEAARADFQASMLLPGLTIAFHAATLGRSRSAIAAYRRRAQEAASRNPDISHLILAQLSALSATDGLQMARLRGRAQLCHWSLLAIAEYRARGHSRREIADAFRCSPETIAHALQFRNRSYDPLSGVRRLTAMQQRPPKQFTALMPR